ITAEQSALRPLQYLDTLDGAEGLRQTVGERIVNTVNIGRDARIGVRQERVRTDAADIDDGEVDGLAVVDARDRLRQTTRIVDALGIECVGRKCGNRDRNVLNVF